MCKIAQSIALPSINLAIFGTRVQPPMVRSGRHGSQDFSRPNRTPWPHRRTKNHPIMCPSTLCCQPNQRPSCGPWCHGPRRVQTNRGDDPSSFEMARGGEPLLCTDPQARKGFTLAPHVNASGMVSMRTWPSEPPITLADSRRNHRITNNHRSKSRSSMRKWQALRTRSPIHGERRKAYRGAWGGSAATLH
jgi:hypothetical protein